LDIIPFLILVFLSQIATELSRLIQLAGKNMLATEDISGGTITVSNFGAIGGKFGSPIINVPEVAIVAIGRMQQVPRLRGDGSFVNSSVMTVRSCPILWSLL
jgi:2-oxoisovalerate dehydrogenase E2 component (dihydrolipoyl transacylase)